MSAQYRIAAGLRGQQDAQTFIDAGVGQVKGMTLILERLTRSQADAFLNAWPYHTFRWINVSEA